MQKDFINGINMRRTSAREPDQLIRQPSVGIPTQPCKLTIEHVNGQLPSVFLTHPSIPTTQCQQSVDHRNKLEQLGQEYL
jgi:hypothetical protein